MATGDKTGRSEEGLSGMEYLLFSLLFLVLPAACVVVSSVLYYVWRKDQPRRANQINTLGFIIFGVQIALYLLYTQVIAPK
jgi:hypothetical protein